VADKSLFKGRKTKIKLNGYLKGGPLLTSVSAAPPPFKQMTATPNGTNCKKRCVFGGSPKVLAKES